MATKHKAGEQPPRSHERSRGARQRAQAGGRAARTTAGQRRQDQRRSRPARQQARVRPGGEGRAGTPSTIEIREVESLRAEIERCSRRLSSPRWNADPDDVRRSVAKLVLTLVEFVRELLERQAIRRMDAGTLTEDQTEAVGLALMRLEETIREMAAQFGLDPQELNLDLGPVGRLM